MLVPYSSCNAYKRLLCHEHFGLQTQRQHIELKEPTRIFRSSCIISVVQATALLAIGASLASQAAAQKQCDLKFARFSRGSAASFLDTVEHHITLTSSTYRRQRHP